MIDWQYPALTAAKTAIEAISGVHKVGEYPDDLALCGGSTVVVLVSYGDEVYDLHTGDCMDANMDILVKIYVPKKKGHGISKALLIQNDVVNAILADLTLAGTVTSISLTAVRKGDISTDTNNAGYTEQMYIREILFNCIKTVAR